MNKLYDCDLSENSYTNKTEPWLKEFYFNNKIVGTIRRNNYNAEVLCTPNMLIADIDLGDPQFEDGVFFKEPEKAIESLKKAVKNPAIWLKKRADKNKKQNPNQSDNRIVAFYNRLGFRIYRTAGGLRYICTSHEFEAVTPLEDRLLRFLYCDPRYRYFSRKRNAFAARLTPKPWRGEFNRVCDFLGIIGSSEILPQFKEMIVYHDLRTQAEVGNNRAASALG